MKTKKRSLVALNSNSLNAMIKRSSMNKTTRVLSITIAMFAVVGMMSAFNTQVFAAPPGVGEEAGKKVYQFNMIGRPNAFSGGCGEGNRVFVEADDKHAHMVITDGDKWNVTDCNGTGGQRAELTTADAGQYVVYAVAKGKPGTGISVCADYLETHDIEGDLCEIGTFEIKKDGGKTNFSLVPAKYFDASLEDLIWSIDVNGQAKIQFRVYELIA